MRGPMQQGWGPQGHLGGNAGQMMGQGVGPGRMVPNINTAMATRGPHGSRAMVNMQMMGNGEREKKKIMMMNFSIKHDSDIYFFSALQRWRWQTPPTLSNKLHPIRLHHGQTA